MQAFKDMATSAMGGGPAGPAGPQAGSENVPSGQNNDSNAHQQQQQQQQPQQQHSQNTNSSASQEGHKLSDKPIIPDERFARPQPQEPKQQEEPEPTLASKYGITLPAGVPMEGTNTYTGVRAAEDLSSNLPVIVSIDTTVAHTGLGSHTPGAAGSFGFTGAADNAHSAAYGGAGSANSPEVMAKKAADITTALGVNDHIAGI